MLLNLPMAKEHRRELYGPVSVTARQVPDVAGPDGVRVTLRVEPAVDRLRRWRFMFFTPPVLTQPVDAYVRYRILPDLVQKYVLRDRWAVDVEADSGRASPSCSLSLSESGRRTRQHEPSYAADCVPLVRRQPCLAADSVRAAAIRSRRSCRRSAGRLAGSDPLNAHWRLTVW
jgi:hypothetical protein